MKRSEMVSLVENVLVDQYLYTDSVPIRVRGVAERIVSVLEEKGLMPPQPMGTNFKPYWEKEEG